MANTKTKSTPTPPKSQAADDLRSLFEEQLKDIYWAEKALTKALPKMAKNAASEELADAITTHLEETKAQVQKLEQVFESIGKKAQAKKCDAMEGLLKEGEGIIEETEPGPVRDAGIIGACQKVEHYEIATYGTLASFAKLLGENEADLHNSVANLKVISENLKVVSTYAKSLTGTLAQTPWRLVWGGKTPPLPSEEEILKSKTPVPIQSSKK